MPKKKCKPERSRGVWIGSHGSHPPSREGTPVESGKAVTDACQAASASQAAPASQQGRSGVTLLDVPDLLAPINRCLLDMQLRMIEEKLDMMDTLQKDPVPQYSLEQIETASGFLSDAMDATRAFLEDFKPTAVKRLTASELQQHLQTARKSSRRLMLLFGDQQNQFSGSSMKGSLLRFSESTQSQQVRARLESLSSFLSTFSQASWLGDLLRTADNVLQAGDFERKIRMVTTLLDGLLSPKKTPSAGLQDELKMMARRTQAVGCGKATTQRVQQLQQRAASHPHLHASSNCPRCRTGILQHNSLNDDSDDDYYPNYDNDMYCNHCGHGRHGRCGQRSVQPVQPAPTPVATAVQNPLEGVEKMFASRRSSSWEDRVKCLSQMSSVLSSVCEGDGKKRIQLREQHNAKMEALKQLAEALNAVPGVLNQYLLVRLGDIDSKDLGQLKAWITHDEATQVHMMLEEFRDEAIYERAVRDMSTRTQDTR